MIDHRATRLIATLGPASDSEESIRQMIEAGVDVFRLNLSHGTLEEHAALLARVRTVAETMDRPAAVMADLPGPKVRTSTNLGGQPLPLSSGDEIGVRLHSGASAPASSPELLVVRVPGRTVRLAPGSRILIDDGRIILEVTSRRGPEGGLRAKVIQGGAVREKVGVHFPSGASGLRFPTAADLAAAAVMARLKVDFLALSFVQTAAEIRELRGSLQRRGFRGGPGPALVAKLEKPAALEHLDDIFLEVDGVMVARGDLGVELPLESIAFLQKDILRRARRAGLFTITATQMLDSMTRHPGPTRAEVTDIANAILDGSDALMLAGETAVGQYPLEAVRVLDRVSRETDRRYSEWGCGAGIAGGIDLRNAPRGAGPVGSGGPAGERGVEVPRRDPGLGTAPKDPESLHPVAALARAAVQLAVEVSATGVVVFTRSGRSVRLVSRERAPVPILALCETEEVRRFLSLAWNTRALVLPPAPSAEVMMRNGLRLLREKRWVRPGDALVLMAGETAAAEGSHLLRLLRVSGTPRS